MNIKKILLVTLVGAALNCISLHTISALTLKTKDERTAYKDLVIARGKAVKELRAAGRDEDALKVTRLDLKTFFTDSDNTKAVEDMTEALGGITGETSTTNLEGIARQMDAEQGPKPAALTPEELQAREVQLSNDFSAAKTAALNKLREDGNLYKDEIEELSGVTLNGLFGEGKPEDLDDVEKMVDSFKVIAGDTGDVSTEVKNVVRAHDAIAWRDGGYKNAGSGPATSGDDTLLSQARGLTQAREARQENIEGAIENAKNEIKNSKRLTAGDKNALTEALDDLGDPSFLSSAVRSQSKANSIEALVTDIHVKATKGSKRTLSSLFKSAGTLDPAVADLVDRTTAVTSGRGDNPVSTRAPRSVTVDTSAGEHRTDEPSIGGDTGLPRMPTNTDDPVDTLHPGEE